MAIVPIQLTMDALFDPPRHGGRRAGSGRRRGTTCVPHREREQFSSRSPLHVTLRCVDGLSLRRWHLLPTIHAAIARGHTDDFRVCELNVEANHLHLLNEARDREALGRGLQRLESMLAHDLNYQLGRSGALFEERYHARVLSSPTEVRNALRYVLNNARHHAADTGLRLSPDWFDPYSSALWFGGWSTHLQLSTEMHEQLAAMPRPTEPARTWLLGAGWQRLGLLAVDEIPGSRRELRGLERIEEEREHQARMRDIDLEWRCLRGELEGEIETQVAIGSRQ